MDIQTFAVIAAIVGFIATLIYLGLGLVGVKTLRDMRNDALKRNARNERDERS